MNENIIIVFSSYFKHEELIQFFLCVLKGSIDLVLQKKIGKDIHTNNTGSNILRQVNNISLDPSCPVTARVFQGSVL